MIGLSVLVDQVVGEQGSVPFTADDVLDRLSMYGVRASPDTVRSSLSNEVVSGRLVADDGVYRKPTAGVRFDL